MIFEFIKINPLAYEALQYVNRFRKAMGMDPLNDLPKGTTHATGCPIAKAVNHRLRAGQKHMGSSGPIRADIRSALREAGWGDGRTHPVAVQRFISAHDRGEIQDYRL